MVFDRNAVRKPGWITFQPIVCTVPPSGSASNPAGGSIGAGDGNPDGSRPVVGAVRRRSFQVFAEIEQLITFFPIDHAHERPAGLVTLKVVREKANGAVQLVFGASGSVLGQ